MEHHVYLLSVKFCYFTDEGPRYNGPKALHITNIRGAPTKLLNKTYHLCHNYVIDIQNDKFNPLQNYIYDWEITKALINYFDPNFNEVDEIFLEILQEF